MGNWISTVKTVTDKVDYVSAEVVNPIIATLAGRDQYLYEQLQANNSRSQLTAIDQIVGNTTDVAVNSIVFYQTPDIGPEGLDLAIVSYEAGGTTSLFAPSNSSFVYGIVKSITVTGSTKRADVYLSGLIGFPYDSNNAPVLPKLVQTGETFRSGPYYLSKTEAGKLTSSPGGLAVYVGYAKNDKEFFLSTNPESVSQLFLNYKFNLLDRPVATPSYDSGGDIWSIAGGTYTKPGWIPVTSSQAPSVQPTGASFFYFIPSDALIDADTTLSDTEKQEAKELKRALPPYPATFNTFLVNGVVQSPRDDANISGTYTVDITGVYWYGVADGTQPWASDYTSWPDHKGTDYKRPKQQLQFVKINPELKLSAVTSLKPFKDSQNDTSKVLQLLSSADPTKTATVGSLLAKFNLGVNALTAADSNVAINTIAYNPLTGNLDTTSGKVVSSIEGNGNILVAESVPNSGKFIISSNTNSFSGLVNSIEPENARFDEYTFGLHSSLILPYPSGGKLSGLIGKFLLPGAVSTNFPLSFTIWLYGATSATGINAFKFEYAITKPGTALSTATVSKTITLPSTTYVANVPIKFVPIDTLMQIPGSALAGDSFVNFRLQRATQGSSPYTGDVGIIGISWNIG